MVTATELPFLGLYPSGVLCRLASGVLMPIPWMPCSRLLASFARCCTVSRLSIEPIIVCSGWSCAARSFFVPLPPCLVGMEACAAAHYWARELTKLGHEVPLRAPMAELGIVLRKGVKGSNSYWPSLRTKRMTVCPLMLVQPALGM